MAETTFGVITMPDYVFAKSMEILQKLSDVEILYILASKPKSLGELTAQLKTTFGLESTLKLVSEKLADLRSREFVRSFSSHSNSVQGGNVDFPHESLSITPLGLSVLTEWIESLSTVTLTMQLGLNQRIAIAEE